MITAYLLLLMATEKVILEEMHQELLSFIGRYSGGRLRDMTLMSYGRIAIESSNEDGARIYLNPNGANVHVADADDNYHDISASKFNQSSSIAQKRNIKDYTDDALAIINSLEI